MKSLSSQHNIHLPVGYTPYSISKGLYNSVVLSFIQWLHRANIDYGGRYSLIKYIQSHQISISAVFSKFIYI